MKKYLSEEPNSFRENRAQSCHFLCILLYRCISQLWMVSPSIGSFLLIFCLIESNAFLETLDPIFSKTVRFHTLIFFHVVLV